MKKIWGDVGIAVVMGMIVPAIVLTLAVSCTPKNMQLPEQTEGTEPLLQTGPSEPTQPQMQISVLHDNGQVLQMELDDYLTCVVLAEMPVSFEDEALKAQSVVARTYTMRAASGKAKHADASVCTNSSCCQGYMTVETFLSRGGKEKDVKRIENLINATDGQVLTYEGNLIEATYFSCSGGTTEDAVAVWGTDVPYLQSVESPGEEKATHYTDTVTFTSAGLAAKLGMALPDAPSKWFSDVTYTNGGGVATMTIGEETFTGTELRKLLGLRSTAFEIEVNGDSIIIMTRGYGHRVGMSQYGADAMAASGSTYPEILEHYYQGTELTRYMD